MGLRWNLEAPRLWVNGYASIFRLMTIAPRPNCKLCYMRSGLRSLPQRQLCKRSLSRIQQGYNLGCSYVYAHVTHNCYRYREHKSCCVYHLRIMLCDFLKILKRALSSTYVQSFAAARQLTLFCKWQSG